MKYIVLTPFFMKKMYISYEKDNNNDAYFLSPRKFKDFITSTLIGY